jgi:hypothetical protein
VLGNKWIDLFRLGFTAQSVEGQKEGNLYVRLFGESHELTFGIDEGPAA